MTTVDFASHPVMAPISISAAGDNIIVAGIPNNWIYIHQIALVADGGANLVTLKKGATDLSYIPLIADMAFVFENTRPDYPYLFDIESNVDFIINLTAATSIKGHIIYSLRK